MNNYTQYEVTVSERYRKYVSIGIKRHIGIEFNIYSPTINLIKSTSKYQLQNKLFVSIRKPSLQTQVQDFPKFSCPFSHVFLYVFHQLPTAPRRQRPSCPCPCGSASGDMPRSSRRALANWRHLTWPGEEHLKLIFAHMNKIYMSILGVDWCVLCDIYINIFTITYCKTMWLCVEVHNLLSVIM